MFATGFCAAFAKLASVFAWRSDRAESVSGCCACSAPATAMRSTTIGPLFRVLVLALVEVRELHRIEQVCDLLFGQHMLVTDDLENPLAARIGLVRQLGGLVISDHRVQCRDDADRCF